MDILSLNLKAPYTRTNESAVIFNNISNLLPSINSNVKRLLKAHSTLPVRRHSACGGMPVVPSIEVIPPSPGSPDQKLPFEIVEINKVFADTLNLCRRKIRRFSEPCFPGQLNVSNMEENVGHTRRKSMPCISSKYLLKVPKQSRKKKRRRRHSLPMRPDESDFPDYNGLSNDSRSLSGSYEKIHYCHNDEGLRKTVHEIFIPGFGAVGHSSADMNKDTEIEMERNNNETSLLADVPSAKAEANTEYSEYSERATAYPGRSSSASFINEFETDNEQRQAKPQQDTALKDLNDVNGDKQSSLINSINTPFNNEPLLSKEESCLINGLLTTNTVESLEDRDNDCQTNSNSSVRCSDCNTISSYDRNDRSDARSRTPKTIVKTDKNCERITASCLSKKRYYIDRIDQVEIHKTRGVVTPSDGSVVRPSSEQQQRQQRTCNHDNVCLTLNIDNCPTGIPDNNSSLIILKHSLSLGDNCSDHNLDQENIRRIEELTAGNNMKMVNLFNNGSIESADCELQKSYDVVVDVGEKTVEVGVEKDDDAIIMSPTRSLSNVLSDVLSGKTTTNSESNVLFGFHSKDLLPSKVVYNVKNDDVNVVVTSDGGIEDKGEGGATSSEEEDQSENLTQVGLAKATSLTALDSFQNTKKSSFKPELRTVSLHEDSVNNPELLEALSSIEGSGNYSQQPRDENKPTSASMEGLDEHRHSNSHRVSALNRLNKDFANAMLRKAVSLVEIQNERLKENIAKFDQKFLSTEVLSAPDGAEDWFPRVSMEDCSSCASCRSRSSSYHSLLYDFDTANRFPIYQPTVIDFNEEEQSSLDTARAQADKESVDSTEVQADNTEVATTVEDSKTKMLKAKKERIMKQGQAAFGSFKDKFRRAKSKV